jgi:hypothetical protein
MTTLLLCFWAVIAAINHQELRQNPTAAVGTLAKIAEIVLALAWPLVLCIFVIQVVTGKLEI